MFWHLNHMTYRYFNIATDTTPGGHIWKTTGAGCTRKNLYNNNFGSSKRDNAGNPCMRGLQHEQQRLLMTILGRVALRTPPVLMDFTIALYCAFRV